MHSNCAFVFFSKVTQRQSGEVMVMKELLNYDETAKVSFLKEVSYIFFIKLGWTSAFSRHSIYRTTQKLDAQCHQIFSNRCPLQNHRKPILGDKGRVLEGGLSERRHCEGGFWEKRLCKERAFWRGGFLERARLERGLFREGVYQRGASLLAPKITVWIFFRLHC